MIPLIVIVGADKGGVGKTMISRALLDYFKFKGINVRAFDTESPNGTLHRFFPENSTIVDLTTSDDQMVVFDNINRAAVTVIDIRAGLLSPSLIMLSDIGFLDMIKAGKIKVVVLHLVGSTVTSLNEIKDAAAKMHGAQHFVVKNHTNNDSSFFSNIDSVAKDMFNDQVVIEIPKLDGRAAEHVDAAALPFDTFMNDERQSFVARGYVRKWLQREVFPQFDIIKFDS